MAPSHVGICVADLERSLRFYVEGLGFTATDRYDLDSGALPGLERSLEVPGPVQLSSQMVVHGALKLELLHYPDGSASGVPSTSRGHLGLTHLCFTVEDQESVAARLVACGGQVLEHTRSNVGVSILFLADPDGTRIELLGR